DTSTIVENGEVKVNKMIVQNGVNHHEEKHMNGNRKVPNQGFFGVLLDYDNVSRPDQVIPADSYTTSTPGDYVKLRVSSRGVSSEPPISVPGLLNRTVARYPDATALATKKADGKWHKITYKQYQERVRTVAKAFIKLGLEKCHSVCILGFNSEQWYIADLAAIHAGGYAAGIYTTNSADACYHCLVSSRANIVAVQDKKQLDKILSVRDKLPLLKAIVQWEGTVDTSVQEMGAKETDSQLNNILKSIAVNECCTLVYTVVDIYTTLSNAIPVFFAQPDALKGSLVETLKEVRPTRFLGVPRVWEKMYEKIMAVGAKGGTIKRAMAKWAREQGLNHHLARIKGQQGTSFGYKMAKSIVFSKVHESLGLDKCTTFVTAAAPLFSLDSAGELLEGTETMFGGSVSPNGPGEIRMRGRHVFMGYLDDDVKTRDAVDDEGWLLSGDIGRAKVNPESGVPTDELDTETKGW
ncbi:Long-chain-fatty-acid--CoA ligase ACSBG2, partial [Operophtera brumata]